MTRYVQEPRHGTALARTIHAIMIQASKEAARQLQRGGYVNLYPWVDALANAAIPILRLNFDAGRQQRARQLLQVVKRRRKGLNSISWGFDIGNQNVTRMIEGWAHSFAESTLRTASVSATEAYRKTREALHAGLSEGDTQQELNRRLFQIFGDVNKASRIAQTEAMRAVNGGSYMLAMENDDILSGTEWLASPDACSLCLALNGQKRKFGEPYYVDPKGGPYAVCLFPPRHPGCFCVTRDLIDPSGVTDYNINRLQTVAGRKSVWSRRLTPLDKQASGR